MFQTYIVQSVICLLVLAILLYGCTSKRVSEQPRSREFILILLSDAVLLIGDLVDSIYEYYGVVSLLRRFFLDITFYGVFVSMIFFIMYLYHLIGPNKIRSAAPFMISGIIMTIMSTATIIGCITGLLYEYGDGGAYMPGPLYDIYLALSLITFLPYILFTFYYRKELGMHNFFAVLTYPVFPILAAFFNLLFTDISFVYPAMAMSILVMYVVIKNEAELTTSRRSLIDQLTGLNNRRAFEETKASMTTGESLGVVFADLNNLKYTNDTYGHLAGDDLICNFSDIILMCFRHEEIFRIGGDEFVVLMPGISQNALRSHMRDFRRRLTSPHAIPVASVGCAYGCCFQVDDLIAEAEKAMYAEKQMVHEEIDREQAKLSDK